MNETRTTEIQIEFSQLGPVQQAWLMEQRPPSETSGNESRPRPDADSDSSGDDEGVRQQEIEDLRIRRSLDQARTLLEQSLV